VADRVAHAARPAHAANGDELSSLARLFAPQKITDKCFTRCVLKPGARLDDSEKMCTAKCMDRYLDAMALVSQAWAARAKQQASMQGGLGGGGFE
jgi:hypothetical protein